MPRAAGSCDAAPRRSAGRPVGAAAGHIGTAVILLCAALLLGGCTSAGVEAVRTGSASVVTAGRTDPAGTDGAGSQTAARTTLAPESTTSTGAATASPCPTPLTSAAPVTCLAREAVAAVVAGLAAMPAVARTKLLQHLPVEDQARERATRKAFVAAATAHGVPYDVATAVVDDQIAAATGVQQNLLDSWTSAGTDPSPGGPVADLARELRPEIDAARARLAAALVLLFRDGVPDGWQGATELAQADLLPTLPDGVTALDLAVALRTLRDPLGDGNVLQE